MENKILRYPPTYVFIPLGYTVIFGYLVMRYSRSTNLLGSFPAWIIASACYFIITYLVHNMVDNQSVSLPKRLMRYTGLIILPLIFLVMHFVVVMFSIGDYRPSITLTALIIAFFVLPIIGIWPAVRNTKTNYVANDKIELPVT